MNKEVTTSRRINESVRGLRNILAKAKVTEAHPLILKTPVKITQTLDGRGCLDWADVSVKSLWHDREDNPEYVHLPLIGVGMPEVRFS